MTPLFESQNIEKTFGGLQALSGVDVSIDEGELVGLIGPNGAGKTTFFNCVTGYLNADSGRVEFAGEEVTGLEPYQLANRGLVRTFQLPRAFESMTILENVQVAGKHNTGEKVTHALRQSDEMHKDEAEIRERAKSLLRRFEIDHLAHKTGDEISSGDRKVLELARGLMLDPNLFLLDEPFAGVPDSTVTEMAEYIQSLNDEGMTFIVIEHGLEELVELVDRLIVLHEGSILADGDPDDIVTDEQVIDVYMSSKKEAK